MNLHLLEDEKFSIGAVKQFEEYFPGRNIYIINAEAKAVKYAKLEGVDNVFYVKLFNSSSIQQINDIISKLDINKLFVHYLTPIKASIATKITQNRVIKTYWIFFGADLYNQLYKDFKFDLFDRVDGPAIKVINSYKNSIYNAVVDLWSLFFLGQRASKSMKNFFRNVDFFCFWNENDYKLLKEYYNTRAQLKQFIYYNALAFHAPVNKVEKAHVIINHSASLFGNHLTIVNKIQEIDPSGQNKLIIPLSYGLKEIREEIVDFVEHKRTPHVVILDSYLDLKTYTEILEGAKVAIFGMKRQEGAGNIFMLLYYGAKVFLRNGNNLLTYYRDRGFIIFSFEDDLKDMSDLAGLSDNEIQHNQKLIDELFKKENIDMMMKEL